MTYGTANGSKSQIFLYAENWPAHEGVSTTGLDRALVPLIEALQPWQPKVLLAPRSLKKMRHKLNPIINDFANKPSAVACLLDQAWAKIGRDKGELSLQGKYYAHKLRGEHGTLFSVLGGDGRGYLRAAAIAAAASLRHVIYCVDDPFSWADERRKLIPELQDVKSDIHRVMCEASAIIAITAGLADALALRLGRQCSVLALPYLDAPIETNHVEQRVMYVGNLNHLYADSFLQVIEAVRRCREEGFELRIRATFNDDALNEFLPEKPDFLDLGPINERRLFLRHIAESCSVVCPISFQPSQVMVKTSFPSKMLDYLAQSRCIVVHGPEDSIAATYLSDDNLPFVTSDVDSLHRLFKNICATNPDHRFQYRRKLEQNHGGENFRLRLGNLIGRSK